MNLDRFLCALEDRIGVWAVRYVLTFLALSGVLWLLREILQMLVEPWCR